MLEPTHPYATAIPLAEALNEDVQVASIAAGFFHSVLVTRDGRLITFGRNDEQQLGRPTPNTWDSWKPAWCTCPGPSDGPPFRRAFASGVVTMALDAEGSLWTVGSSRFGQLLLGRDALSVDRLTRVDSALFDHEPIEDLSLGWGHGILRTRSGRLLGWGFNPDGRTGLPPRTSSSALHLSSSSSDLELARLQSHVVWRPETIDIAALRRAAGLEGDGSQAAAVVACGVDHSLILCGADGKVLSMGDTSLGQRGVPSDSDSDRIAAASAPPLPRVTSVSAGVGHSVATDGVSNIWVWGSESGVGEPGVREVHVQGETNIRAVAAGRRTTLVLGETRGALIMDHHSGDEISAAVDASSLEAEGHHETLRPVMVAAGHGHGLVLCS